MQAPTNPVAEKMQGAAIDLGILGFDPYTDAIDQPLHDGVRIWYYQAGEVRFASRTRSRPDRWNSPASADVERLTKTLTAAEEFNLIDKRAFNRLVSGPLSEIPRAHEGIAWGIARLYGPQIERGTDPTARQLQSIPGIGEQLGRSIASAIRSYQPSDRWKSQDEIS